MGDYDPYGGYGGGYGGYGDPYGGYGGGPSGPDVLQLKTKEEFDTFMESNNEDKPAVVAYIPEVEKTEEEKKDEGEKSKDDEGDADDEDLESDEPEEENLMLDAYKGAAEYGMDYSWAWTDNAELLGRKLSKSSIFVYKPFRDFDEKYDKRRR